MQTRLASVHYDAARGAFEGRVDVQRDGRTFRYPCRLEAPADAPPNWVEATLTGQALRMSDTDPRPVGRPAAAGLWQVLSAFFAPSGQARPDAMGIPVPATDPRRSQARF